MLQMICGHAGMIELLGQLTRQRASTAEEALTVQQLACKVFADVCKAATACAIELQAARQFASAALASDDLRQQMLGVVILEHFLLGKDRAREETQAAATRPRKTNGVRQHKVVTNGLRKLKQSQCNDARVAGQYVVASPDAASKRLPFSEWLPVLVWCLGHANLSIRERCWEIFDAILKARDPTTRSAALRSMLTSGCVLVAILHQTDNHCTEQVRLALQGLRSMLRQATVRFSTYQHLTREAKFSLQLLMLLTVE